MSTNVRVQISTTKSFVQFIFKDATVHLKYTQMVIGFFQNDALTDSQNDHIQHEIKE